MSLTCLSCKMIFSVPQFHQEHYKTDWHRYNVKRRAAGLPSVTREEFDDKASAFKDVVEDQNKKLFLRCESCNKHFSTQNAMNNHLKSKKHLELQSSEFNRNKKATRGKSTNEKNDTPLSATQKEDEWSTDEDADPDDDDDGEWESCDDSDEEGKRIVVDTNDCLFCDHQSDSTENNVSHMTEAHSFFIPDIEYVNNLDGLIASLAAKIHLGHFCLWCCGKGKGFKSVKSVKQHMLDKGHCKMLYEGEILFDYADFYDYSTVDDIKESDVDEIEELLEDAGYELVLPSGATVGHRSLARYYKQNLQPVSSDSKRKVKKVLQQYKALGYTGASGPAALKAARDISYVQKIKQRYNLKLGMKQNKFQPHFRPQVLF